MLDKSITTKVGALLLAGLALSGCARSTDARNAGFIGGIMNQADGTYARQRSTANANVQAAYARQTVLQQDSASLQAERTRWEQSQNSALADLNAAEDVLRALSAARSQAAGSYQAASVQNQAATALTQQSNAEIAQLRAELAQSNLLYAEAEREAKEAAQYRAAAVQAAVQAEQTRDIAVRQQLEQERQRQEALQRAKEDSARAKREKANRDHATRMARIQAVRRNITAGSR